VGIGIAVSAFLVARLAGAGIEWQGQWLWAGALAAGSAAAALVLLPARDPVITTAGADRTVEKFGLPLIILTIGYGLFGFGYVITATFINAMAKTVPQLQPVEPWVWMVVGLSGLPSLILWNRLARVTGYSLAYTLACLVEAVGVMLSVLVQTPAALVASAVMLGGTFMALSALGFNLARSMEGGSQGRAIAVMTASFGVGQMAGPVVAGFLFERSGDLFAASMLAGGALVAAALLTVASSAVSGPLKTA
jgi:predicted MFS family arabinose efflux permease